MENDSIEIWGLVADWFQAIGTVAGLLFIWWQIRLSRKAVDYQALIEFNQGIKEHESALIDARTDNDREKAFVEILNFFEVYAAASNHRLLRGTSKKMIDQKLTDSLATIQANPNCHDMLKKSISSPETFEEIYRFYQKRKARIQKLSEAMADAQT